MRRQSIPLKACVIRRIIGLGLCLTSFCINVIADEPPPLSHPKDKQHDTEEGFADVFEAAHSYDPQLERAYWTLQAEKEEANQGLAQLLPSIGLSASYQYEDSDNIYTDADNLNYYDPDQERSSGQLVDTFWRVNLRQPLLNYPAYENYLQSKAIALGAEYRYLRAEQELIYRVADRFIKVLLAAQQVYLNQQKLDALELKRVQAIRAQQLGIGDQLEVLYVNSNRDLAHTDLIQAQSALIDAKTLLANVTGYDVKFPEHWIGSSNTVTPTLQTGTEEEWLSAALNNMSVKAAQARIEQEKHNLAARKGEHYPTLDLNLSYLDRKSEDDFRTRQDAIAALEFRVPIYSGGQTSSNIRKARARLHASESELDYVTKEKQQQIKLSYNRLKSFKERLLALAESRESSRGYLDAAERQLSLDLNDQVNVLDARTQFVDTKLKIAQTLNDYLLSDLTLRLESGLLDKQRLLQYDELFNSAIITK